MATALSSPPSERIRRVDLFAYVFGLMGATFVGEFALAALSGTATTYEAGMGALGGFALLGAVQMYRDPDALRRGDPRGDGRQRLPVRMLRTDRRSGPSGRHGSGVRCCII
jgi:hypothetical protein